jgi:hypothetical protein
MVLEVQLTLVMDYASQCPCWDNIKVLLFFLICLIKISQFRSLIVSLNYKACQLTWIDKTILEFIQ